MEHSDKRPFAIDHNYLYIANGIGLMKMILY